jgi:hypothetical protein
LGVSYAYVPVMLAHFDTTGISSTHEQTAKQTAERQKIVQSLIPQASAGELSNFHEAIAYQGISYPDFEKRLLVWRNSRSKVRTAMRNGHKFTAVWYTLILPMPMALRKLLLKQQLFAAAYKVG